MELTELYNLFEIRYGVNLELNKMVQVPKNEEGAINFVSRTEKNNGISAIVKRVGGIEPNPANTLSVAGGGSVLATFLQTEPYYSGRDLYVLIPKREMIISELVFYAQCIRKNKYRYNYGRQANRTLKYIKVPTEIPQWVYKDKEIELLDFTQPINNVKIKLEANQWGAFRYDQIFDVKKGKRLIKTEMIEGKTPFIGAIDSNNGVSNFVGQKAIFEANTITVNYDGNGVAESYYQPIPYFALDSVNVLYPKFDLNPLIAMFLIPLIRKEKYRFNYGRKWHLGRMKESIIKLPITSEGKPDWQFMEDFIKSLPYSKAL